MNKKLIEFLCSDDMRDVDVLRNIIIEFADQNSELLLSVIQRIGQPDEDNLSSLDKEILRFMREDSKVEAIKFYRDAANGYGSVVRPTLNESKEYCDELWKKYGY